MKKQSNKGKQAKAEALAMLLLSYMDLRKSVNPDSALHLPSFFTGLL